VLPITSRDFFGSVLMKPRTVCFRQPVASMIFWNVAPPVRLIIAITFALAVTSSGVARRVLARPVTWRRFGEAARLVSERRGAADGGSRQPAPPRLYFSGKAAHGRNADSEIVREPLRRRSCLFSPLIPAVAHIRSLSRNRVRPEGEVLASK
jgi:hypothetical protein